MSKDPNRLKAIQMLLLCTMLWALSFPTMRALGLKQQATLPEAGTWFFTSLGVMYRFGAAGLVLLLLSLGTLRQLGRLEVEQGIGLALFGVGGILLQMDGLAHTSASTSAFLTQCYAIFIPIWVAVSRQEWPAPKVFVSCVLVLSGVAVLAGIDLRSFRLGRGEGETLLASVLFTGQILWLERPCYAWNSVSHFSTVMFLAMSALCVPLVYATAPSVGACVHAYDSTGARGFLAILVLLSTLGGYMIMNHWQRRLTATEAGLIYCAEPLFASLMVLFIPGWFSRWGNVAYANEPMTTRLLLGGGLITAANVLIQWPGKAENR
jgi:drug/metabolite transporter (DMT)-like permease